MAQRVTVELEDGVLACLQPADFPAGFKASDLPRELQYPYDPQKSKALLAEAGFPNGISFTAYTASARTTPRPC